MGSVLILWERSQMSVGWSDGSGRCEYPWWSFGDGVVLGGVGLGGGV